MSHQSAHHLPPCSEGLSCMVRKNPRRSNAALLLAISLQNALALPKSAGFILQELITTSKMSEKNEEGRKKENDTGHDVIKKGQSLWFDGSLHFFSLLCLVLLFLFWSLLPKKLSAAREREREREIERDMQGGKTGERGGKDEREQERQGERETLLSHSLVQEEFHCLARHLHGL